MTRRIVLLVIAGIATLAFTARTAYAQVSLERAKELYASAAYDDALTMLNNLTSRPSEEGPLFVSQSEEAAAAAMYRVLCLVALGRSGEVDAAIERLVSQYPLYRPPSDELSPRIRNTVTAARVRVLPSMIQKRYGESKAAYDRSDFASAAIGFKWVLSAMGDPDISSAANQSPLADLRTLATGFSDLSEKAMAPPPPPSAKVTNTNANATVSPAPVVPSKDYQRLFTPADGDVVAPVTVRQPMPRFPGPVTQGAAGVLELVIDATGAVESVRMLESVHPNYDQLVVNAAKKWQYQPARLDGVPVRYQKRIQVSLTAGR